MQDHYSSISIDPQGKPQSPRPRKPRRKIEPVWKTLLTTLRSLNPYVISALVAALLFGSYCGLGFLLVPPVLKARLSTYFQKHTDLELAVGQAHFNPLTFQVHLADITTTRGTDAKKEPALFKADALTINFKPFSLLQHQFVCESLRIDRLSVTVIRYNDKKYNFSQVFTTPPSVSSPESFEFSKLPFLFSLNNISITNGTATFDDRVTGKTHKAEKIELALPTLANIAYQAKRYVTPRFSAVINGSPVQLTGETEAPGDNDQAQTRISFDLHALDLPLYFGYLPLALPVQLEKGMADGQIQLSFLPDPRQSKRLNLLFRMDAKDLEVLTLDRTLSLTIPTARIEGDLLPFTGDLHIRNMLFHEPKMQLQPNFSEKTLDSLLPAPGKPSPPAAHQPGGTLLELDLFLVDNGSLLIHETQGKKEPEKTYQSLQLTIKNYANHPAETRTEQASECTFKLSGEQLAAPTSFSWQGGLDDKGILHGALQLNRFPASLLGTIVTAEKETAMTGTADMTGNLSIARHPGEKKRFSYTLAEGSVKIADLGLMEAKQEWLHAAAMTIGPIDSKNNGLDIGNLLLQNATVTLHQNHLPSLLDSLIKKGSSLIIHGVDFAGNIILKPSENTKSPLVLNGVSLQANTLEKDTKDKENFAVTGKTGQAGEIKAKGTVALGPLRTVLALEFSGIQSKELFPWYTDAPFLLEGQARIDGQGRFSYPESAFKGSLRITEARFDNKAAKSSLAWAAANFQDVAYTKKPFHLTIQAGQIEHPVLTYLQEDDKKSIFEHISSFMQGLLPKKEPEKPSKQPPAPDLLLKEITIDNGTLVYRDLRLAPPWQQEITAVHGKMQNVQIPAAGTTVAHAFAGTIAGRPLTIEGTANLFTTPLNAQTVTKIAGLPLSVYKEQLAPLLSIDPGRGAFDLTLQDAWKDGRESSEATFLFQGLTPSAPAAESALLLALLAGKRDSIELKVPIAAPEDKQHAPVFTETVKYFKVLLAKSIVAPLLLTDENFSQLAVDDTPDFVDGESILSEKGKAKLTLYRDLLTAHPRLMLEIAGMADMALDKRALQEKLTLAEKKRVDEENIKRAQEWQRLQNQKQQHPGQQKSTIVEKDIPAEELARYAPIFPKQIVVDDQALIHLAGQRTASAYEYFTSVLGLGTERVVKHTNGSGQAMESINRVRVTLHPLALAGKQPAPPEPPSQ